MNSPENTSISPARPVAASTLSRVAVPALLIGAVGIAFAPIFVRLSELGPSATGFHRLFMSLPVLWLWTLLGTSATGPASGPQARRYPSRAEWRFVVLAGFFFAGDMALWHWSIRLTSVANATLLANFAPVFVALGAWLLMDEIITRRFLIALAVALGGTGMVMGASLDLGQRHVLGDVLGVLTALFYAGYILSVKQLRTSMATGPLMFWTGVFAAIGLLLIAVASGEGLIAVTWVGWAVLVGLALISHCGGQSLIAFSLAHLPASFSSLTLLLQPVIAAVLAWVLLAEPLGRLQAAGGAVVLLGILLASRSVAAAKSPDP